MGELMTNKLTYRAGEIVLLRAEIIGLGSDGPYVRVETGSGRATCFWAPRAAVVQIERDFDAQKENARYLGLVQSQDPSGSWGMGRHFTTGPDELGARSVSRASAR
jgi:hypothetical protein